MFDWTNSYQSYVLNSDVIVVTFEKIEEMPKNQRRKQRYCKILGGEDL